MTYTHFGEMVELLPIDTAALLLGLVSGVTAVHLLTSRMGRLSLQALMGVVALAALLSWLVAAKPGFSQATPPEAAVKAEVEIEEASETFPSHGKRVAVERFAP